MGKIILFYTYTNIDQPHEIQSWQKQLCRDCNVTGRVLIATEGINATLGGTREAIDQYIAHMRESELFSDIVFKESEGSRDHFPRLQVLVRPHLVNLGVSFDEAPLEDRGTHLSPDEAHQFIQERIVNQNDPNSMVFDARNNFESRIGTFENAHTPDIDHFRDLPEYIEQHPEEFHGKDVLMYCTGGIRCERASALLKQKGLARNVYQLAGGIHAYTKRYPNGYFKGKNYVFDGRISVRITDDVLTTCDTCNHTCDMYTNCINAPCNKHMIQCDVCREAYQNACSTECYTIIMTQRDKQRSVIRAEE